MGLASPFGRIDQGRFARSVALDCVVGEELDAENSDTLGKGGFAVEMNSCFHFAMDLEEVAYNSVQERTGFAAGKGGRILCPVRQVESIRLDQRSDPFRDCSCRCVATAMIRVEGDSFGDQA